MNSVVRLGIAGPGKIVRRVMKDLRKAEHIQIAAVASRSLERAQAAALEMDIPVAFGSYEEMAKSDLVDLVYVATPHPFHCPLSLLYLENGKHVIVEKPFALNGRQAREMIQCAKAHDRFLMEAMWTRFFPMAQALKKQIEAGELGEIRRITGDFAARTDLGPESRLFDPALGGGSLLDLGIYPLSLICFYKGALPEAVQVFSDKAATGVDSLCSFQVRFADGAVGQGFSAVDVRTEQAMRIYGTEAWVEIPDFWHGTRFFLHRPGQAPEEHIFSPEDEGYYHEFEYAAQTILRGEKDQPVIPLPESLTLMDIMDEMRSRMNLRYPGE